MAKFSAKRPVSTWETWKRYVRENAKEWGAMALIMLILSPGWYMFWISIPLLGWGSDTKYVAAFGTGVFIQVLLSLHKFQLRDGWRIAVCLIVSTIGLVSWGLEPPYAIHGHLFFTCLCFAIMFACSFAIRILGKISEIDVYSLLVFLWCTAGFQLFSSWGTMFNSFSPILFIWLFAILLAITGIVGWFVFTSQNTEKQAIRLYTSYVVMVIILGLMQFSYGYGELFVRYMWEEGNIMRIGEYFDVAVSGTLMAYVLIYLVFLWKMMERTGRGASNWSARTHQALVAKSFWEQQLTLGVASGILLALVAFFMLNYHYFHISDGRLISVFFVLLIISQRVENFYRKRDNESAEA